MKKVLLSVLAVVLFLSFVFSCKKNDPAAPADPTATRTITCTVTNTMSVTVSPTITCTPTSTSTPPDLYIDNFEDGNLANLISTWGSNSMGDSVIHYQGLITPPPGNGSYAYALTTTVQVAAGMTYGYATISTGPTGSALPLNARAYNKLMFLRRYNGTVHGGTKTLFVTITDDVNMASYQIGSVFSTGLDDWELNLRQSYSLSGGTIDDLLSNIKQINFTCYTNGVPGDAIDIELVIDDVRFVYRP